MVESIAFGIDLGTTNSCIARWEETGLRIFPNREQMNVTPSVVYMKKGRMWVGVQAYDAWINDPENVQSGFKRWMGFNDALRFPAANRSMSAEELSAEVLKSLKGDVTRVTGEEVRAAVITVPAAFSTTQCEATAKAAEIAGFEEFPLIQEPIAAAIAYGSKPKAGNERWLVFDLGGGTLDIAVVSTHNDMLKVLNHEGDNLLGGKDIDRLIVSEVFLPWVAKKYKVPEATMSMVETDFLYRRLTRLAERAKIELATSTQSQVDFTEIGSDLNGTPIDFSACLERSSLEKLAAPLIARCVALAERAVDGARIGKKDIDRILLVGGPTQMPCIRAALASCFGGKVECSLDPMTVVARGAALHAATIERSRPAATVQPSSRSADVISVRISYDRASGSGHTPLVGVVDPEHRTRISDVRIDAEGGYWSSGWISLIDGQFEARLMLRDDQPATRFQLSGRDLKGKTLTLSETSITVIRMMALDSPPLPHEIRIEIMRPGDKTDFDPVFARNTPLPAQVCKTYRAHRALNPSEAEAELPLKLWEFDGGAPSAKKWLIGSAHIYGKHLKRPLLVGDEIELHFEIDTSRRITISGFVPRLNFHFSESIYVAREGSTHESITAGRLEKCYERIDRAAGQALDKGDVDVSLEVVNAREALEAMELHGDASLRAEDPEKNMRAQNTFSVLESRLAEIELKLGLETEVAADGEQEDSDELKSEVGALTTQFGTEAQTKEYTLLCGQMEAAVARKDQRLKKRAVEGLNDLRWRINWNRLEFWGGCLNWLSQPETKFVDAAEAHRWTQKARQANAAADLEALREACRRIIELRVPDLDTRDKEMRAMPGILKH